MPRPEIPPSNHEGLPQEQWLFGDRRLLPDRETKAAFYWEFGLETPQVISEVNAVRRKTELSKGVDLAAVRKWHSDNPYPGAFDLDRLGEWGARFRSIFPDYIVTTEFHDNRVHFLFSWREFPSKHWLQIPDREKKSADRMRQPPPVDGRFDWANGLKGAEARGTFGTVPGIFYKGYTGLIWEEGDPELRAKIGSLGSLMTYVPTTKTAWGAATDDRWTEYRMVTFSWARSDRKLKADFAEWLKENRPDDRSPYHKTQDSDSRRTTERDLLKALGALRLLRYFKGDWKAAARYSEQFCKDKRGNSKPLYVEQSEWRDAEKRAKRALSEFHRRVFSREVFG